MTTKAMKKTSRSRKRPLRSPGMHKAWRYLALGVATALILAPAAEFALAAGSELDDEPKPYLSGDKLIKRAAPLIEIGDPFLETGNLHPGYELPGGAIWQPRLWVYGSARSAVQTWQDRAGNSQSEWVNRLDLFANLQLTGTERIVLGIQPLHRDNQFTGRQFDPERSMEEYNSRVRTLFFEGDIAELFPGMDPTDKRSNDIGFSIGRQPLFFQDGFLIQDQLDAIGLSRNNMRFSSMPWLSSLRVTAVFAWNEIHRGNNIEDDDSKLFGVFGQWDTKRSTINTDIAFVQGGNEDDLWVAGIDAVQRFGAVSTTFRVNASYAPDQISAQAQNGTLLFAELGWSPPDTDNNLYANAFYGFDRFRSAARDPLVGGPLGRTGILFAARGLGAYPSAINNQADKAYGVALGYQMFFHEQRRQLLLEAGARDSELPGEGNSLGLAVRFQQAFGKRYLVLLDAFASSNADQDDSYGTSAEFLVKF